MTATESRTLRIGARVCWEGNIADGGKITKTSWDSVTITWDNHHVATVYHGDMQKIRRAK
jgi:hypothetical protein